MCIFHRTRHQSADERFPRYNEKQIRVNQISTCPVAFFIFNSICFSAPARAYAASESRRPPGTRARVSCGAAELQAPLLVPSREKNVSLRQHSRRSCAPEAGWSSKQSWIHLILSGVKCLEVMDILDNFFRSWYTMRELCRQNKTSKQIYHWRQVKYCT